MIEFGHQGPFRAVRTIVLASASPRRQQLLTSLGIAFQVVPSSYHEPKPSKEHSPREYAEECALGKTFHLPALPRDAVALTADTVVARDGRILGKPKNVSDALEMLRFLCGHEHEVITACTLLDTASGARRKYFCRTRVRMNPAEEEVLRAYASCGEPLDKAGAYAIQGAGGFLISSVSGSASNVIGLPLAETVRALLAAQAIAAAPAEVEA